MTPAQFQLWLNQHGASPKLTIDGRLGPKTRAAILEVFRNTNAPVVSPAEVRRFGERLGGDRRRMRAVAATESAGSGYDDKGRLKALYERHYLWKRIQIKVPLLSDPTPGGYTVDADKDGINDNWEKVADAACRFGPDKAFECASWGLFQIMGAWWQKLGYDSSVDFVWQLTQSETAHYEALCRYVENFGLIDAFKKIDGNPENCRDFARLYNGPTYAKNDYHGKIAYNYRRLL